MEAALFIILICAAAGIGLSFMQSLQRLQAWKDAAVSSGLQVLEAAGGWMQLRARAGPVEVQLETCGDKGKLTRIVVKAPGPPDFHLLRIRPEALFQMGREIEIGDESFDRTFFIEGPRLLVFALLDAAARREMLLVSAEARLEISSGALQAELSDENVSYVLPLLLDLRQQFAPLMDVPRRLAENAHRDPEDRVRLHNLLLLARELPGEAGTREALRKACSDPSPEIQLWAGKALGAEGRDALLEVAERMVEDHLSAEAVFILERELSFERARSILRQALRLRRIQTACACLEVLGDSGAAAAVDTLATVMEQEGGELAAAAAQALGATGSPAAEPALILALQRDQADLRVAAANALGRVGSVAAVLPLQEAAERSWLDRELRRAARQAIAEIQSRLQGASPGQLSLAGADAGQLSLATAEEGQLSLATDPAGQLSFSGADAAAETQYSPPDSGGTPE